MYIFPHDFINKMICEDYINIVKYIPDNSVDLIITDPPYLKSYSTGHRKNIKRSTTKILSLILKKIS